MADQGFPMMPAFPHEKGSGINVREYIATRALQGILAASFNIGITHDLVAQQAVQYADALLLEICNKANK